MARRAGPPNYRLKLRGGFWYVVWSELGKPKRLSTGTRKHSEAREWFSEFLAGTQAAPVSPTIGQMLDAYLLDRDGKVIDHKELSRTVGKLKAHFGNLKPHHLNKMVVANYTRARMETVQGSTVRGELLILRAAFKWGTPEWVRVNPTIETPPAGLPRERWLTRSEAARLLWGAKAHHMRLFIRLALYTTARTGAILGLTWDRVDFERRTIDYRDPRRKMTSKRRVPVPIGRRLYRALKQAHRIRRTSYVVEYGGKGLKDVAGGVFYGLRAGRIGGCHAPHPSAYGRNVDGAEGAVNV